jgi:hypothetical protein
MTDNFTIEGSESECRFWLLQPSSTSASPL